MGDLGWKYLFLATIHKGSVCVNFPVLRMTESQAEGFLDITNPDVGDRIPSGVHHLPPVIQSSNELDAGEPATRIRYRTPRRHYSSFQGMAGTIKMLRPVSVVRDGS